MRIKLVKCVPANIMRGRVFDDVALPFFYALSRLGHQVEITNNALDATALNIVFGANIDPLIPWLKDGPRCVIVNLEQFRLEGGRWAGDEDYLALLAANEVWDYSESNVEFLKDRLGRSAAYFRFGYVPEMSRIRPNHDGGLDVLFYGALNDRRAHILAGLDRAGARVRWVDDAYGLQRDRVLYDSKVVVNIHSGRGANLEIVRLGYLMANRKAVASEFNHDTERYSGLETACAFFPYEELVEGTLELLKSEERRRQQAEAGFAAFSAFSLTDSLRELLGRRCFPAGEFSPGSDADNARPQTAAVDLNFRLDVDRAAETEPAAIPPFLTGPWVDWAGPEEEEPPAVSDRPDRRREHLALWAKRIRAFRYRFLIRIWPHKKHWRINKLEKIEREISDLKAGLKNKP